ncbi:DUF2069 domain-containing protein [Luteimonas sp. 100069]|uniref:DUF2069 domain-containing protein n=1 Tax=Luteimonas sp. 100069 TaxID=2006109 RepID=UPI000F502B26|nr:DUF2069 domain-containing protein [Luteimonas sp. 100069]RPD84357.1 DUF2069 domain-containing protein [Luteimonas sp. 100069]
MSTQRSRPDAARSVLACSLALIAVLYLLWHRDDPHFGAALIVFVLPPLVLLAGVLRGLRAAPLWSGIAALFWFSHGVMYAWSHPELGVRPWAGIALSLAVVFSASLPGLRARFGRRSASAD